MKNEASRPDFSNLFNLTKLEKLEVPKQWTPQRLQNKKRITRLGKKNGSERVKRKTYIKQVNAGPKNN